MQHEQPITQLLSDLKSGRDDALHELLPLVYKELRRLADNYLKRERTNHTLQPTALVHEAYIRLVGQRAIDWQNRAHFFGVAAHLMREILIDYARAKNRKKRGGEFQTRVTLPESFGVQTEPDFDVLAMDEALTKLEKFDREQSRVVELRFFGGLTIEETAQVLNVSPATVKREWQTAKLWLLRELK